MPLPPRVHGPAPGPDDFRLLRERGYYYVDKTHFVTEFLESSDQVILIPRPRRFGKTVNLSTLRYFLEKGEQDRSGLFEGLTVSRASPEVRAHQGRYPVIFASLKEAKATDFETCLAKMRLLIQQACGDHPYLLTSQALRADQRSQFEELLRGRADRAQMELSLRLLSGWLEAHHGMPAVLLIDEYDAPIEAGYVHGHYDEVVSLMRGLLGAALKTNPSLFRGVLTGVQRVSKESLFSDLNNVRVRSMLEPPYSAAFGFTEEEVADLLAAAGRSETLPEVRRWYDGYVFGGTVIYNPWSVLCFAQEGVFRDYWVATSADALLRKLLLQGEGLQGEYEILVNGGAVEKRIDEHISLRDIGRARERVWSVLLTAGYLKALNVRYEHGETAIELAIPNLEVMNVWRRSFSDWLQMSLGGPASHVVAIRRAVLQGDAETLEDLLATLVQNVLSVHDAGGGTNTIDEPERVYQAFVLGLLCDLEDEYLVRSNRESGYGRADVLIVPRQRGRPGVVLEFKRVDRRRKETPARALRAAHKQIEARGYKAELIASGADPVFAMAVAFDGKEVWVR